MIKVLIAKPGLDGHDRGAKVVARAFEAAGADVIYTGLQASVEEIAEIAKREQVDVVGVSLLSGAHNTLMPQIVDAVKSSGLEDTVFLLGGIIPQQDIPGMLAAGVTGVFGPGSRLDDVTAFAFDKVLELKAERAMGAAVSSMKSKAFGL